MPSARRLRGTLLPLTLAVCATALVAGTADAGETEPAEKKTSDSTQQRPTWAIAHRVLTTEGVTSATKHGANALEIDATAWKKGWWADHDGTLTSYGDTMEDMFDQVVREHRKGRHVSFVWLDMKNPDWCDSDDAKWRQCSVAALRDMARSKLEPEGIRVLYGFYGSEGGSGWKKTIGELNSKEAVSFSGSDQEVREGFAKHGPDIPRNQRVMDNGLFSMALKSDSIHKELRFAGQARDRGELARTVGWTVGKGDRERSDALLDSSRSGADVDALIYGNRMSCYPDGVSGPKGCGTKDGGVREALSYIQDYVKAHPETRRMAGPKDIPFGS
ncbi:phospholipase [Streptomyces sp. HNM0574]|uniref:phospholipase n=1 Tax=Streptomyces sp. HNM0574 TaxID=2714954 RepID=UPI00146B485E|nr:phospholipase [Streptomyces sp. HNM0574]NLU70538.1 phospholipase [Streptomyces sp. HNM0574]